MGQVVAEGVDCVVAIHLLVLVPLSVLRTLRLERDEVATTQDVQVEDKPESRSLPTENNSIKNMKSSFLFTKIKIVNE